MSPWSDAFESSVVWTRRQLPLPFSRLPAGKCYKASASAPRQYQQGTMCSPVAWGLSIIFSFIIFFFIFKLCATHKEWARGHSLSEDKWNHLLRAPLTLLEKDGAEQSSSELPPQPQPQQLYINPNIYIWQSENKPLTWTTFSCCILKETLWTNSLS